LVLACFGPLHSTPGFVEKQLTKGWIEKGVVAGRLCYRITDQGLAEEGAYLKLSPRRSGADALFPASAEWIAD
jgi:hypothetical protein